MTALLPQAPADPADLRRALYGGALYLLPPDAASLRLCDLADELLAAELGLAPRLAQFRLSPEELFTRIGALRKVLFTTPRFHEAAFAVMAGRGFVPTENAIDPLRLRVVLDHGDEDPRAAPVYYPHRDTWYAHPQCQITWWVALHDAAEDETFVFYPERFDRPVPNSSETFDYDAWVRDGWDLKIGWQRRDAGAAYPGVVGQPDGGPALGFSCRRGEVLLFAGAHFHRTLQNRSGRTRFSLDFRSAHLGDHAAGIGAPNVDSRCRGSALRDYTRAP